MRFAVPAPPPPSAALHCAGCWAVSASACSLTLVLPAEGFALIQGEPVTGGLHGPTRHLFCPHCLTWIFTRPEGMDEVVNPRATLLDEHGWLAPLLEIWTGEAFSWARTPAPHSVEPERAARHGLIEGFARRGARPG